MNFLALAQIINDLISIIDKGHPRLVVENTVNSAKGAINFLTQQHAAQQKAQQEAEEKAKQEEKAQETQEPCGENETK